MRLLPSDPDLGWTPYAWLVYLPIFYVRPILAGAGVVEWAATIVATAIFFVLYFRGYWYRGRVLLPYVIGLASLGAVFSPFNPGASVFFVYAAAFIGFAGSPRSGVRVLSMLLVFVAAEAWLLDVEPSGWIPGLVFSALIGGVNIHYAEAKRRNARLGLAHEEVERTATAAERERIARDLHDLLGHSLSVITLKSELAGKLIDRDPERARREITEIEQISRGAMAEVRKVVTGFRARQLGVELTHARLALASADVDLEVESSPYDLSPAQESVLALALREAVTNVVRHAGATRCTVRMRQERGEFRLVVQDDGRGGNASPGSGLRGMAERVEALGGTLERDGSNGMRLTVSLPLEPPRKVLGAGGR
ncbi:MAG TPA: sensor histidine kinase [Candidatus Polarisedimenticolaceae bacterium]|nr:sensor histidine kinase [Candidatus Polarisedimenticolaceae bacterium]